MFILIIIGSFLDWAEKLILLGSRPSCGPNLKGVPLAGEGQDMLTVLPWCPSALH